uniref:Dual specificity protein phosphatase 8 n=1 Tax=Pan troglodytes TaxID=9598 RepID=H2RFV6_PANTR
MAGDRLPRKVMDAKKLASLLRGGPGGYNSWHVLSSVNICCSKLVKWRLQKGKVTIAEFIQPAARSQVEATEPQDVVVYDQSTRFLSILLSKLDGCFHSVAGCFHSVAIITGGFATFSSCFPDLCEGEPAALLPMSLSQSCLLVPSVGLTLILPHLYLGSQEDVLNKDLMTQNGIIYVLYASNSCPKPDFIYQSHFLRVPINDNYCEKLLPWLDKSIEFVDKAKLSSCQVIVHRLAGISCCATIAIAYIMKTMGMSSEDAYRFVKDQRPSISPNFNFLGQLLEYQSSPKLLAAVQGDAGTPSGMQEPPPSPAAGAPLPWLPPPTSETAATRSAAAREGGPSAGRKPPAPPTATSTLQQGLRSLRLSSDHLQDTSRLKPSFSLDIKSAYAPSRRPGGPGPATPARPRSSLKAGQPVGATLGLPSPCPDARSGTPTARRAIPRAPASPGAWTPPLDSLGTLSPDVPRCFSPKGVQGPGRVLFAPFGRAGAPEPNGCSDLPRREAARAEPGTWPRIRSSSAAAGRWSSRRAWWRGARAQGSFSGSVEVIEMS